MIAFKLSFISEKNFKCSGFNFINDTMRYKLAISLAILSFALSTTVSYLILNHFYGQAEVLTMTPMPAPAPAPELEAPKTPEGGATGRFYSSEPIAVVQISGSIGIAVAAASFLAVWVASRNNLGDAAAVLLDRGLHDMTLRDLEIVGQISNMREFTIPELMARTGASKITVWRTVQRLMKQGLVEATERTQPGARGLGGRGKPSRVYRFTGGGSQT
jgi:predicted DNA-binding transcriptional regulator AlpA